MDDILDITCPCCNYNCRIEDFAGEHRITQGNKEFYGIEAWEDIFITKCKLYTLHCICPYCGTWFTRVNMMDRIR